MARLDSLRGIEGAMKYTTLKNRNPNGICGLCNRAIDDHSLTYTEAYYPLAICPTLIDDKPPSPGGPQ